MTETRKQQIARMHKKGMPDPAIGAELGVSRQSVWQARQSMGLDSLVAERRAKVAACIAKGDTPKQITRKVKADRRAIYRDAYALGLVEALKANKRGKGR